MPEKYQEEIEEILKKVEEVSPPKANAPREPERPSRDVNQFLRDIPRPHQPRFSYSRRWPTITPGKILLAGLVLFLVSALLKITLLIWVGLGMLVVAYLLFFVTPRSMSYEKRWRGQALENRLSMWDRFKRWLKS